MPFVRVLFFRVGFWRFGHLDQYIVIFSERFCARWLTYTSSVLQHLLTDIYRTGKRFQHTALQWTQLHQIENMWGNISRPMLLKGCRGGVHWFGNPVQERAHQGYKNHVMQTEMHRCTPNRPVECLGSLGRPSGFQSSTGGKLRALGSLREFNSLCAIGGSWPVANGQ